MNTVEIILELLKSQNKKQKELTQFLGISETSVADWKRGKTESYKKHIGRIAEFFGVSTDYLLGNENTYSQKQNFKESDFFQVNEGFLHGTGKHKAVLPVPVAPHQTAPVPAKVVETKTASTIDLYNPKIAKAYNGLTTEEQLKVQMFILDTAAASEKSNAKVEVIEKTE